MTIKMDEPLVSIIIPVYNSEIYMAETILSALAQTWPYKEIIIIDDGSTDRSLSIAKSFESNNVKVYHQDNKGASAARNMGLKEAKGDFIQFLDADDLLSPDKITGQVKKLQQNPGKIVVCSTIHFKDSSSYMDGIPSPYEESFLYNDDEPVHFLIDLLGGFRGNGSMIAVHSWLVPRGIIEKAGAWNEGLKVDDDGEFFCRVILNSRGIIKTDGISYYRKYNNDGESLSSQNNKEGIESAFRSIMLKRDQLLARSNSDAAHKAIYNQLLPLAIRSYLIYQQLYNQIGKELARYPDHHYIPHIGGRLINYIAKLFGWKTARRLQIFYSKKIKN